MEIGSVACADCDSKSLDVSGPRTFATCGHPSLRFRPRDTTNQIFIAKDYLQPSFSFLMLAHLDLFLQILFRHHTNEQTTHFQTLKSQFRTYNRLKQYYLATPHDRSDIEEAIVEFFEHRLQNVSSHRWDEYIKSKKNLLLHWNHKPFVTCALLQSPSS